MALFEHDRASMADQTRWRTAVVSLVFLALGVAGLCASNSEHAAAATVAAHEVVVGPPATSAADQMANRANIEQFVGVTVVAVSMGGFALAASPIRIPEPHPDDTL